MPPFPAQTTTPATPGDTLPQDADTDAARWERWAAALLAALCEA